MRRAFALAVVAAAVAAATVVGPAGATHQAGDQFIVELEANGDAEIVLEETFNLTVEEERTAFERLEGNETAREQRRARFGDRLAEAAARSADATGREMNVSDPGINVTRADEETGVVRLRVRWTGLAAVETRDGDRFVIVTEPFAGGFEVNRSLVVRGPDGYTRAGTTPPPGVARKNVAIWGEDTDLEGLEAAFAGPAGTATDDAGTPTGDEGDEPTPTPRPSAIAVFLGAAALALVPAVLVALGIRRARE